jgi:uncharacterized protein (TIGR00730 family)
MGSLANSLCLRTIAMSQSSQNDENVSASLSEEPLDISDSRRDAVHQRNDDLIQTIKQYADKLAADEATRGDLKILARTLRELRYAFKVFTPYRNRRKVTMFGSARIPPEAPTYQQAVELGRAMADEDWMVVTGAAHGIMEAGHVGAGRKHAMGINILLPFEQGSNAVIADDPKLIHMKYFFTRKLMFVKECDAVVCLPGGFGTMDEALEVLTLLQTGKRDMVPLVLLDAPGGDYWKSLHELIVRNLLGQGLISQEDLSLYRVTDSVEQTVAELLGFFRIYHSMRYVKQDLVLRLLRPLSDEQLDRINRDYAEILESGGFVQSGALPEERDEPQWADLPRLVCAFNRYNFGRLRQLIDYINSAT